MKRAFAVYVYYADVACSVHGFTQARALAAALTFAGWFEVDKHGIEYECRKCIEDDDRKTVGTLTHIAR